MKEDIYIHQYSSFSNPIHLSIYHLFLLPICFVSIEFFYLYLYNRLESRGLQFRSISGRKREKKNTAELFLFTRKNKIIERIELVKAALTWSWKWDLFQPWLWAAGSKFSVSVLKSGPFYAQDSAAWLTHWTLQSRGSKYIRTYIFRYVHVRIACVKLNIYYYSLSMCCFVISLI